MAASMTLGGTPGMSILMGNNSPLVNSGMGMSGNHTPSHAPIKYESGTSSLSVHSPHSNQSSTPNSAITINSNSVNPGSMQKCPGSGMNGDSNGGSTSGEMMSSNDNSNSGLDIFGSKCKRKINFSNLGIPPRPHLPATVARRNARERNRVKQVNNGFSSLKQHIPLGHRSKKMSKVETLRCAVDYIRNLQGLLTIHNGGGLGHSFSVASPADSNASTNSGDILMDDENDEMIMSPSTQEQQQQQHQQMNGVSGQRDAYALSSGSSSSSSPTSSEFGAVLAQLPQHLAALHSHHHHQQQQNHQSNQQQQQHLGNSNNQLRHLSALSQHHHHLHGSNGAAVAAALLLEGGGSGRSTVTPNSNQLSPTSSEDPASPSYTSEVSYVNVNSNGNMKGGNNNGMYDYEKYEPVSPEDEELLDAIAWWQQS